MHYDVSHSFKQEEHEGADPDDPERFLVSDGYVRVGRINDQLVACQYHEANLENHETFGVKDLLQDILALLVARPFFFHSRQGFLSNFYNFIIPADFASDCRKLISSDDF